MKLLIIAGPYEADRIRKAALSAGFETLAVEPGESLSGWITASRPELIIMAPQIVHPDPAQALAKVRATPRGRVPIFLVGDAADEPRLTGLADGFFVRPVAPEPLFERARAVLAAAPPPVRRGRVERADVPPARSAGAAGGAEERTVMGVGAIPPAPDDTSIGHESVGPDAGVPVARPPKTDRQSQSGPHAARVAGTLKPLVAAALGGAPIAPARAADANLLLAELGAGIDALLDADLAAAVAAAPRAATTPATPTPVPRHEFAGEETRKVEAELLAAAAPAPRRSPSRPLPASGGSSAESSAERPTPAPVQRERAAGRVAAPTTPPPTPREQILARYAPVEDGDYFAVLGVRRDASAGDLQKAHARLLRETDVATLDAGLARELGAQLAAIRTVADEALRILGDDRLRPRYLAGLNAGT